MKKNDYYITQDGELKRKENTIYFMNENTKRAIPVNNIYSIYAYGSLNISSGAILFLGKKRYPSPFLRLLWLVQEYVISKRNFDLWGYDR